MQRVRKIRKIQTPRSPKSIKNKTVERKTKSRPSTIKNNKVYIKPTQTTQKSKKGVRSKLKDLSSIEPIWVGETVFIIGGGPSLSNFNWQALKGRKTIAINKAFYSYPDADILYFTDSRFYKWYKEDIDLFKGKKYTITPGAQNIKGDVNVLKRGTKLGLSTQKDTLSHGNNSGYAAMNLAYLLGAKRIILLGYDMGNSIDKSHFHDGYPTNKTNNSIYVNNFIPAFETLYPLLKNSDIEVYNASIKSKLTVFPRISHNKALSFK